MTHLMHAMSVGTFAPALRSLSAVLDKGVADARAKGRNPDALLACGLAPDMYQLGLQIELSCQHALAGVARLVGDVAPAMAAAPETFIAAQARIAASIETVEDVEAVRLDGAESRTIELDLGNGLMLKASGLQFLRDWALPHFYFHYVTAYDILRREGVQIGKPDYLAHVSYAIRPI